MSNPSRMRAVHKDGITEVRVLMSHVMETGLRKDETGAFIPAHFITEVTARHEGEVVLQVQFGPSVSTNPYLVFSFRGGARDELVSLSWVDNRGDTRTDEVPIR